MQTVQPIGLGHSLRTALEFWVGVETAVGSNMSEFGASAVEQVGTLQKKFLPRWSSVLPSGGTWRFVLGSAVCICERV